MPPRPFSTAPKSKSSFTGFGSIKGPIKAGPFTLSFLGKSSKEKKVNQKDSEHFSSRSQYGRNMEMASSDQFEPLSKNMRKKKTLTQQENWKSNSLPRNVAFPESQSVQISGREPHRLRRGFVLSLQKECKITIVVKISYQNQITSQNHVFWLRIVTPGLPGQIHVGFLK